MTLRARLILAFLLLAVVPLLGVTLYSYVTTQLAFRKAAEEETSALAEDLGDRLEGAAHDLGRRIERLGELPFASVMGPDRRPEGPAAQAFLDQIRTRMGDAAGLVDSIEVAPVETEAGRALPAPGEPAVPATGPIAPARPPPPPPRMPVLVFAPEPPPKGGGEAGGRRWVLQLEAMARAAERAARHAEQARASGQLEGAHQAERSRRELERERRAAERELPSAPREAAPAPVDARTAEEQAKAQQAEAIRTLIGSGAELAAEAVKGAMELAQARKDGRLTDEQVRTIVRDNLRTAAGVTSKAFGHELQAAFQREMGVVVRPKDAPALSVRAQIRPQQLVDGVFARTRRRQGEIPFAFAPDGTLYASAEDRSRLAALSLSPMAAGETATRVRNVSDFVVVTKRDPATGLTVGIARPVGEGLRQIRATAARNLAWGLGMVALALVGIVPLSNRMTRQLGTLTAGAERLAAGDLDARVPVRSGDEIGRLSATFNRMAAEMKAHQQQLLEKERLRQELELCRRIQTEMLPHDRLRAPFGEVLGLSIPAREVGGDFFNYFLLPDGEAALLVGDVSGKGVAAALLMANVQATLRARLPLERDLAALSRLFDVEIEASTPSNVYLTCFVGILDGAKRTLRYVNAGHNAPLLVRADATTFALDSTGRPYGLLAGGEYEERSVSLADGDCLLLYTDGIVESEDPSGEPFGVERLMALVARERESGLDGLLAGLEQAVREFRAGAEAADDATAVILRIGAG
ncbi:MAG: PP2C family protein-serine/threonine phosphatase [Vicinamibacteria bacterium]